MHSQESEAAKALSHEKEQCTVQLNEIKAENAHAMNHLKDANMKATLTLQKESSAAKLDYEKQISDLKAQCAEDHEVAVLKKEEHQTDARL